MPPSDNSGLQTPSAQPGLVTPSLVRAIGRWSLVALTVNSIIGSGIFGLPSVVAGLVGKSSPWAVLLAGAAVGIVIACWAEVASRFTEAGGPYLYARVAFGRLAGIEVGWLLWLSQLAAPAANANLFVIYLREFWPHAQDPVPRFFILTFLVGFLALINYRGVDIGTKVNNFFTIAKLLPLLAVVIVGSIYLFRAHHSSSVPLMASTPTTPGSWLKAILLLVFAYGGFETALTPMAEAKDPRRDTVFALFAALVICTLLYTSIQWIVIGVLPDAAQSERPLADAARLVMGRGGAGLIAIGALVSVYGYLSAKILAVPRLTFALAERGDFPSFFAAVHPRFRTPHVSILVFALLVWALSLFGSFTWNLTLSAAARLFYYAIGCAALPILRKKQPGETKFHLPAGNFLAVVGVIICAVLLTQVDRSKSLILVGTLVVAGMNWMWVRNRKPVMK